MQVTPILACMFPPLYLSKCMSLCHRKAELHEVLREDSKLVSDAKRDAVQRLAMRADNLSRSLRFGVCFALLGQTGKRKMAMAYMKVNHIRVLSGPKNMQGDCKVWTWHVHTCISICMYSHVMNVCR